jgi:hypothetical protein
VIDEGHIGFEGWFGLAKRKERFVDVFRRQVWSSIGFRSANAF